MRPTREGKRFLLATLLIAVAAANTGNNLIYLILAMMLSILVLSVAALVLNLIGLELGFSVTQPVFAKSKTTFVISLSNKKRFLPSYSTHVMLPEGIDGACVIPYVAPLSRAFADISSEFKRRGVYRYGDFSIESGFPFILFRRKIRARVEGNVTVYPELKEIDELIPETISTDYSLYAARTAIPLAGDEFRVIREFRYGDSVRRIQWKASAKAGKLMVKDTGTDEPKLLTIILDNLRPADTESFEKAVSFSASLSYRFIQNGFFVSLVTCKDVIPFGSGQEHLLRIMDMLAIIDEQDAWECLMLHEIQGAAVLVLKSGDSPLKNAAPMCSAVVYASDL